MNKKRIFVLSLFIGLIVTLSAGLYAERVQQGVASKVLRFHVLANSDSVGDQALKLKVRDRIIRDFGDIFQNEQDMAGMEKEVRKKLPQILAAAQDEIFKNGSDYGVRASIGPVAFPTKTYGSVAFPAGTYRALRIEIGEGKGQNWWCVLFPPLCFVDETKAQMPEESKEMLKSVLSEEEYALVTAFEDEGKRPVQIKFKVVELWENSKEKLETAFQKIVNQSM